MKKNFTCIISVFLLANLHAQIAYYDAQEIKSRCVTLLDNGKFKFNVDSVDILVSYLRNYLPEPQKSDPAFKKGQVIGAYMSNPFLKDQIAPLLGLVGNETAGFAGLLSKAGGMDVTNFAVGLADFLADRAKEEVYVNFFLKFKQFLDCHPEFKGLFPNTYALLENFQYWNYANVLVTIREALDKDMKDMMLHMAEFRKIDTTWCDSCSCDKDKKKCYNRTNKYLAAFQSDPGRLVFAGLVMGDGFLKGNKIPTIIQSIADDNTINGFGNTNITNSINLVAILSSSLAAKEENRNYAKISEAELKDEVLWRIYLGLVYQQIKSNNIQFTVKVDTVIQVHDSATAPLRPVTVKKDSVIKVADEIAKLVPRVDAIENYVRGFQSASEDIAATIKSLKEAKARGDKDIVPLLSNLFDNSSALLKHAGDLGFLNIPKEASEQITKVLAIADKSFDFANAITAKNYQRAVLDAMDLTLQIAKFKPGNEENLFVQNLVKYGSFAANVISAKSPADVKSAIQAIALPVGSASIKKNLKYNIGLNAYVGGAGGYEINFADKDNSGASFALYAPIGINFNFGNFKNKPNTVDKNFSGSFSIQLNILDIGSIISYRLKDNGTTESNQFKVRLENIFAPGLNFIGGFPKVPLSIGFGTQWMPTLSRIDNGNLSFTNNTGMRVHAFLAVDIPIINVWSSAHKK